MLKPASAAIFLGFALLGIAGMPPSVTFGDAGELTASAATLGVAHAPGYPLFALTSKAFGTAVSLGNWAYRTNLLCALAQAGALAVFFAALGEMGLAAWARLAAVFFLGFSPAWRHAAGSTEVFALHLFLLSCVFWVAVRRGADLLGPRSAAALGLILGLGMANHHTIVLTGPSLLWQVGRRRPSQAQAAKAGLLLAAFALIGLAAYAYLPLRSAALPVLDWGHPTDWERFLRVFLRKDYGSFSLTVEGQAGGAGWGRLTQLGRYAAFTAREFGWPAVALAALGLWSWPSLRLSGLGFAVLWTAFSGPFFLALGHPPFDAQTSGALERFYAGSWLGLAALTAAGVERAARARPRRAWALCLLPLALASVSLRQWWSRADFSAYDYGRSILRSLPPGASLYMDGGDDTFYTLAFLTLAEGRRRDLDLHDRGGLVYPNPYGPDFRSLPAPLKEERRRLREAVAAAAGSLYYSTLNDALLPGYELRTAGLLRKAVRPGSADPSLAALWEIYPRRWEEPLVRRSYRHRALVAFYPLMRAHARMEAGREAAALMDLRLAWDMGPDALWMKPALSYALALLAYRASRREDWPLAERAYTFSRAAAPGIADAELGYGVVMEKTGRLLEAESSYRRALALDPGLAQARYNLGALYWGQKRWPEAAEAFEKAASMKADPAWINFARRARAATRAK